MEKKTTLRVFYNGSLIFSNEMIVHLDHLDNSFDLITSLIQDISGSVLNEEITCEIKKTVLNNENFDFKIEDFNYIIN